MTDKPLFTTSQYQSVCDSLPDPTFILTESGRYAAILGGKDKRYYHDGSSLVGKLLSDVLNPAKAAWFLRQIRLALSSRKMLVVEYDLSARDVLGIPPEGPVEAIWFEGRVSALDHTYAGEAAVVWVASNITASKRMREQLQQLAMSDDLTGLPNRRRFMLAMTDTFADFTRRATPACLLSFDVDRFKAINDALGHLAGDQALRELAKAVQKIASAQDLVCRLGGDEFAVLCQGRSIESVAKFAQQLLSTGKQVLQPYATPGSEPALSLGIAHFSEEDTGTQDIMRRADQALYQAKSKGGHQVSVTEAA